MWVRLRYWCVLALLATTSCGGSSDADAPGGESEVSAKGAPWTSDGLGIPALRGMRTSRGSR